MDRRAAQSVPNVFFKHKKLQMKQISDKVNLAIRWCKNKGKKLQQLKIQRILTNLFNLMKAITYFASLGIHLLIWKQEKKTFLQ